MASCEGLPADNHRSGGSAPNRGRLPKIPRFPTMARGIYLSTLQWPCGVVGDARADDLQNMSVRGIGNRGNDFSGYAQAVATVVSGDLVRHESKERRQRNERTEDLGLRELFDRLDMVAQASPRDGETRP